MKRAALIAMLIGLTILVAVVLHEGLQEIGAVLARGGWIMLLLVPIHALPLLPDAAGWRVLINAASRLRALFWIASVRHAVGRLLPSAGIGGELVGIRLLTRTGVPLPDACASVVVELLITMASEFFFVMAGILCLIEVSGAVDAGTLLLVSLSLSLPVIIAFGLLLRHGSTFERLHGMARRLFSGSAIWAEASARGAETDNAIRLLFRSPGRLLRSWIWQYFSMFVGCLETWAALHWLIGDNHFLHALIFESLSRAARQIMFFVPAGLGVQELSFVAIGHLLGISGEAALAVSLAKRMSEILYGIPALLSWQWVEGQGILRSSP
jgi:putative membrane protein